MATGEVCDPQEGDKAPEEDFKQVEDFLAFAEEPLDFAIVRGWRTLARAFPDAASLHAFATTHRAKLTLYVWLFNFITYMASPTAKFRALRLADLPFVLWLQLPHSVSHNFVAHGLGRLWPLMMLAEMAYAFLYSHDHRVLSRFMIAPVAVYSWIIFDRIAMAEQHLRARKRKTLSWEEYLCIYVPFAVKGSFMATAACLDFSAFFVIDLRAWQWLQSTATVVSQYVLFSLGVWCLSVHQAHVGVWATLWALTQQPYPLPLLTALLLVITAGAYVIKASQRLWRQAKEPLRRPPGIHTPGRRNIPASAASTPRTAPPSPGTPRFFARVPPEPQTPRERGVGWTLPAMLRSRRLVNALVVLGGLAMARGAEAALRPRTRPAAQPAMSWARATSLPPQLHEHKRRGLWSGVRAWWRGVTTQGFRVDAGASVDAEESEMWYALATPGGERPRRRVALDC